MTTVDISGVSDESRNLANLLQGILDRVISTFDSYGMPTPTRRYYTFGSPAIDSDQLVVSLLQLYLGVPGDEATEPRRSNDPKSGTFLITLAREVPVANSNGTPPKADDIQRASEVSALDAWILMESAREFDASWANVQGGLGLGVIATVDVEAPEGGYQLTRMTITMAVP